MKLSGLFLVTRIPHLLPARDSAFKVFTASQSCWSMLARLIAVTAMELVCVGVVIPVLSGCIVMMRAGVLRERGKPGQLRAGSQCGRSAMNTRPYSALMCWLRPFW
ncbi:hypothetical protein ARUE_113p00260 (plasmid) [Arthrobacter sp. Rue61a]|nr:hypothetical protein ARUE_113p00260 [Arthrobacter sp. Rue61a]